MREPEQGLPLAPEARSGSQMSGAFSWGEAGTEARTMSLPGIDRGQEMGTGGRSKGPGKVDTSTK